jgi:hypothetical protein
LLKNPNVKAGRAWAILPTLTAATQVIQTLGNDLGLNLIAAGKFGPLSEGEMRLAMDQSLPDETLGRTELAKWVETRGAAKAKLASYLRTLALKLANKDISREEIVNLISAPRGQADTQTDSVVDWNSL